MIKACEDLVFVQRRSTDRGGRPPLVFFPGWGSHSEIWAAVHEDRFRDWDCYFVDYPGFGPHNETPPLSLSSFLKVLREQLPKGALLIGWSLGGMLASQFAHQNPSHVRGVVTVASNAVFVQKEGWSAAMERSVFESFVSQFSRFPQKTYQRFITLQVQHDSDAKLVKARLLESAGLSRARGNPDTLAGVMDDRAVEEHAEWQADSQRITAWKVALDWLDALDNRSFWLKPSVPFLNILGRGDVLVPVASAERFSVSEESQVGVQQAAVLKQLIVLDGKGHALPVSAPGQLAEEIEKFAGAITEQTLSPFRDEGVGRDKRRVADAFSRAAQTYDQSAHVQIRTREALLDLYHREVFPVFDRGTVLDLGSAAGQLTTSLDGTESQLIALDIAHGMLAYGKRKSTTQASWVCADMDQLPIQDRSVSGVISNVALQWSGDLKQVSQEVARVLLPGGWFLVATLGPQTLAELKSSWSEVDDYVHVNTFAPVDDLMEALQTAGLDCLKCHNQKEVIYASDVLTLMRDLKAIGAHNVNPGQRQGLMTRKQLQQLEYAYEHYRCPKGLPITYDVIYTLARKPGNTFG